MNFEKKTELWKKGIKFFFTITSRHRRTLKIWENVNYDKSNGIIKDIPALFYNKSSNHFTLKNIDKRVSTLKGLTPKKKQGTVKNLKNKNDTDSDNDD